MVSVINNAFSNISAESTPSVFLDTNVAFDLISGRQPFYDESRFVVDLAHTENIDLVVSSGSLVSLIYLASDKYKLRNAEKCIWDLVRGCSIANTTKTDIGGALFSTFRDKEDALQYFTAFDFKANYFITRNLKDFKNLSPILPVLSPLQFARLLASR